MTVDFSASIAELDVGFSNWRVAIALDAKFMQQLPAVAIAEVLQVDPQRTAVGAGSRPLLTLQVGERYTGGDKAETALSTSAQLTEQCLHTGCVQLSAFRPRCVLKWLHAVEDK